MKLRRFFGQGWVIAIIAMTIGFLGGMLIPYSVRHTVDTVIGTDTREYGDRYQFISPLLSCADDDPPGLASDELSALEKQISDRIAQQKANGAVSEAGVYVKELNGGPHSAAVNDTAAFTPGSLLKVPLAMSVYQTAEHDPQFLSKQIQFEGGTAQAVEHYTAPVIAPGIYVEELVRATLVNSDNDAALLLAKLIGKDALDNSYSHLGIAPPASGFDYSTSVRTYASFFRILFNATYLSRTDSEHVLSTLSQTAFKDGIVAGVPAGTVVAHKFGERALSDGGLVQLHDCGIVYKKNDPYLVCIMMRGSEFSSLARSIAEISKLVWDALN